MQTENNKVQRDKEIILSILKYTMITIIVLFVLYIGVNLFWILFSVVLGFILAHLSNRFSVMVYRLFMRKRPHSADVGKDSGGYRVFKLVNYTLFILLFIGIVILLVFILISQIRNLLYFFNTSAPATQIITDVTNWLNNLSDQLGGLLPDSTIKALSDNLIKIQNDLMEAIPTWTTAALNAILGFIGNIPNIVFQAIAVIMSGYYFISDRVVITRVVEEIFPSEDFVRKVFSVIYKVSNSLFRYLGGYAVILSVTFIEALIGLSIIKMPYAVVIALVVTAVDILPAVGASACFFPIAIYMLSQGRIFEGIIALVWVGMMTLVRTALEPKIIGKAMKLHPLATLIAMILGVSFLGIAGILGGPILLILVLGIMESFGYKQVVRDWARKILNKVAIAEPACETPAADAAPASVNAGETAAPSLHKAAVKHIVAWKLKDEAFGQTKAQNIMQIKEKLLALPAVIPQLISMEIGMDTKFDETAYDCVLIATFASYEDLSIYKNHPAHKEVSKWVRQVITSRTVVDFDI